MPRARPEAFHPSTFIPKSPSNVCEGPDRVANKLLTCNSDSWSANRAPRRSPHLPPCGSNPSVPYSRFVDNMHRQNSDSFDTPLSRQRRRWFISEMGKNRQAYTYDKQLHLFAGTWNVNGRSPEPSAEIHKWLFPVEHEKKEPFDVYMLGLQEVQPLTGVDALRTDATKGQQWRGRIQQTLGSDYEQIAERQLVGVMVMVFLRKNHTPYLSNVQLSYAATGFLNAVGNKGGVAARFQLYDRTISCVACHLAAHVEFVERRNQDFRDVVRKAVFLPVEPPEYAQSAQSVPSLGKFMSDPSDAFPSSKPFTTGDRASASFSGEPSVSAGTGPGQWLGNVASVAAAALYDISAGANTAVLNDPNAVKTLEHDVVFWLGDLNYRIEASLSDVLEWIEQRNWSELYKADQLQRQMKSCEIFEGFQEGPIRFPPTYKHHRFKDGYKSGENGDQTRIPSYTDRILWRVGDGGKGNETLGKPKLTLREYTSPCVYSSDHRPVYASFQMIFGVEDVKRKMIVEAKVNRDLDQREASLRPSLQFSSSVDFGDVFFEQRCNRTVAIRNTGSSTAYVTVSLPPDTPSWFLFNPSKWGYVEVPPEKSIQLKFGVLITGKNGSANDLSRNGCVLNTTVRIAAEPGNLRERINIRGRYVATTLGLSLETLSMLEKPVLELRDPRNPMMKASNTRLSQRDADYERGQEPGVVPLPIPKELWLLVHALFRIPDGDEQSYMHKCPDLFLRNGEEAATQRVLSFVDRAEKIPSELSGYAVGSCMLQVLKNLEDSVVPRSFYHRVIEAGQTEDPEVIQGVLDMLPPLNANTFWYIIGFLCESSAVQNANDRGKEIAALFGGALLRAKEANNPRHDRYKTAFIMGAFRIHEKWREPAHRAVFDLSRPASHPKRIVSDLVRQ